MDNPFGSNRPVIELDPNSKNDLARLNRALKSLGDGKVIPAEFRKALRTGVNPAVQKAKEAARNIPSKTNRGKLRAKIARSIVPQVKLGGDARVAVRIGKTIAGDLPKLFNKPGGWEHPVYGNTTNIVHQIGSPGWYDNAMIASGPGVRDELLKTLHDFERRLS